MAIALSGADSNNERSGGEEESVQNLFNSMWGRHTSTGFGMKTRWPQHFVFPRRYFRDRAGSLAAVPAYQYHQLDVDDFGRICAGLQQRGFRSLTASELLTAANTDERSVLLTADDGWSSVWSIGFPLVRRHGLRLTLFLAPFALEESDQIRPGLDDGCDPAELHARDRSGSPLLTWGEVRAMQASGLVEIQSHSSHHGIVFTSNELDGFAGVAGRPFPLYGHVPLVSRVGDRDVPVFRPAPGTPLRSFGPALAAPRRFIEAAELRDRCVEMVRKETTIPNALEGRTDSVAEWGSGVCERDLRSACEKEEGGRWETDAERQTRFREDLLQSRLAIEERLGTAVRVLAPPWGVMHADLPAIARDAGYEMIVLGYPLVAEARNSPLPCYPRLFGDAIWTLIDGPVRGSLSWWQSRNHAVRRRKAGAIP